MLYNNLFGTTYDNEEPCFLTTARGEFVFDRVRHRWLDWASLNAKAIEMSHSWQPREVGIPSIMWQRNNSWTNGQRWAPGLDDTAGLSSELVTNGEDWTAATGATPPTGWTADGLGPQFAVDAGVLTFDATAAGSHSLSQDITVEAGTAYVIEVSMGAGSVDARFELNGEGFDVPTDGGSFAVSAVPTGTTVTIDIIIAATGQAVLDYIRVYLESELTGAGPAGVSIDPPTLPAFEVRGPYQSGATTFFIQKFASTAEECKVWLDVDSDPDPDIALTKMQICESDIEDAVKLDIDAQLQADGCGGLPCVTVLGTLMKKYSK